MWLAIALIGCGGDADLTPRDEYYALEDRVASDCGTYERNYAGDDDPFPFHLCGPEPNVACENAAIAGSTITKLRYTYLDPKSGSPREQNYYAGEGKLVWIGYYEHPFREADWYRADCAAVVAEPYEVDAQMCWKVTAVDCIER